MNIILNKSEIEHKITRVSYQIYETFVDDSEIIIAGIAHNGFILAQKIAKKVTAISSLKVTLCEVVIDKKNPQNPLTTSISKDKYENKGVILVDDVLHSGTTLIYAVKHFLDVPLSKFKTAVLVDRNHKKYPIKADFKGISLSTSLQEHVQVIFEKDNYYAYLE